MPIFFLTLRDRESSFKYFRAQGSAGEPRKVRGVAADVRTR